MINQKNLLTGLAFFCIFSFVGVNQTIAQASGHASVGLGHGEEGYLHLEEMIKHLEFGIKMPDAGKDLQ